MKTWKSVDRDAVKCTRALIWEPASSTGERMQKFGKTILDPRPSVQERLGERERLGEFDRSEDMDPAVSPVESLAYIVLKRTFDLVLAILGLAIVIPFLPLIAILIKIDSRGPVFFQQQRVGRDGKSFALLKFRTMQCSTITESDTIWTARNDPRCTAFGAILRKYSLDELPQLYNVVSGDMSLVGPRPERPYFVDRFRNDIYKYNMRHCCKVGITGWAQVNGLRGDTSISDRLQYDLHYIHNWSFCLDLRILVRTLFIVLKEAGY